MKRLPPEFAEEWKQSIAIYCGRRLCPANEKTVPLGHVRMIFWFGSWSLVRPATLDEYRSIKRARAIRDMGMQMRK